MAATGSHEIEELSCSDSSEGGGTSSCDESAAVLKRLPRAPGAETSRKRSFTRSGKSSEAGPQQKRALTSGGQSTLTPRVSAHERVLQFPGEELCVSAGKLYCNACHQTLQTKRSIVAAHIATSKHREGKDRKARAVSHQETLTASWKKYSAKHKEDLSGTGLSAAVPDDVITKRANVVEAFLKAGIPLSKIDHLRPLLESGYGRLTFSTHMAQLVPFLHSNEFSLLKMELLDTPNLAVIFDGSTRLGEVLAVIVRYVDKELCVHQRLVRVHTVAKSLSATELARELAATLSTELQVSAKSIIAFVRDGAAVNTAAVRSLKELLYPTALDVKCLSHCLDNVGRHFKVPLVDQFSQWWISLFAHSPAARLEWKHRTGVSPKSFSPTRWWSRWEVLDQVMQFFGDVKPFLEQCTWAPATRQHLLDIINDRHPTILNSGDKLRMEIAAYIDAGKPFVTATYKLEGDGPLVLHAYQQLQEVVSATAHEHFPNVLAVAQLISPDDQESQQGLIVYARQCVNPALLYFRQRCSHQDGDMYPLVLVYKSARLCNPHFIRDANPAVGTVDDLRRLQFFDDDALINDLKEELAAYKAAAADVRADMEVLCWWRMQLHLPTWKKAAILLLHLTPSSAAVERVFSLMKACTSDQQGRMLDDQLQLALMLQYNRSKLSHAL